MGLKGITEVVALVELFFQKRAQMPCDFARRQHQNDERFQQTARIELS